MLIMSDLEAQKRDWNLLGEVDPLWAVLSDPAMRDNRWDVREFYRTGEQRISSLLSFISADLKFPLRTGTALDFGCGPGRLTSALSKRFAKCYGVDISPSMLAIARQHVKAEFVEHSQPNLRIFPNNSFDFICTFFVLQHQPSREIALEYIREFLRVLAEGGIVVFQVPKRLPLRHRLQPKRRLHKLLSSMGASILCTKLHLDPISMLGLPEASVSRVVNSAGGRILFVDSKTDANGIHDATYYVAK
jgi:SAM-dependent methyltransferase